MANPNFTVNKADLEFILKQITISERHTQGESLADIIGPQAALTPFGLRTTDGRFNNLLPGQSEFGAADNIFPRLLPPAFLNDADGDVFDPDGPGPAPVVVSNNNYGVPGSVADADPRTISNLLVDMSRDNPAAVAAWHSNPLSIAAYQEAHNGASPPPDYIPTNEELGFIPNQSPDIGLSPGFNGWFTFFGQFFDHGLDLITKGGNGTVYIPLQPDDPLYSTAPGAANFMALTRATPAVNPATGLKTEHTNTTTAFVDQNQTYTSHASHQVFLREYKFSVDTNSDGIPDAFAVATGRLLDGAGGIANWAEVKAQAKNLLGITLTDSDINNVPLLRTDAYGKFIPGTHGFAQFATPDGFVEGAAGGLAVPANAYRTGHAFLDDIAHFAVPNGKVADSDTAVGLANSDGSPTGGNYDNELLDAHFITGDGRGNENIGLTAVHNVFHGEHNRMVEANKATILQSGDLAFINQWLINDVTAIPTGAAIDSLVWDGERLFQAAKFVTEMEYQHLVFEEFARKVQPNVDPFVFSNSPDLDPQILAEFAHVVYRFGHSMLTDTVARTNADMSPNDVALFDAFLNPLAFTASGATAEEATGAIVRGMTRQLGNEIDEFVASAVRNTLLGIPLDLAAINIARARDTGIPTFNDARKQFYDMTADPQLKPYESWTDYAQNIKNPVSIINFIAAYGTHQTVVDAATLQGKRDAATLIVMGDFDLNGNGTIEANEIAPADRIDFLNHTGTWSAIETGLNKVDFWIGGLAESKMEFGGMLGSTFNFVFETQLENLQNGDRFYYLSRLQGTNLLNELEANTFSALTMRNTDLGNDDAAHLPGAIFDRADHILELDLSKQIGPDPTDNNPILGPKVLRNNPNTPGPDTNYLKFRGGEHVVLGGSEGADTLVGDRGIDTLWGDGGNDLLNAQSEADTVFGGDGDDIIIDPFGDDFLRGQDGNDVISAGPGLDIVLGGGGKDFIHAGADTNEVFAGREDDFVMAGAGGDTLLGNEGDDWLEGGEGFDTLAGENSELFFNSPIIGHDVMFGQGNDTDYDGESGDDIMVSGVGIQRNEGMFGFDWSIAKTDPYGVDHDLTVKVFSTVEADILRDRYDLVESMSGWTHDDILRGDNRGSPGFAEPGLSFDDHVLDQAGINRIDGLQALLGAGVTSFRDGNIIIGGDGNDVLQGRGGFDILDGDAWLNVRIAVTGHPTVTSVESMAELLPLMLSREINPSQLSIVREILHDTTPTDNSDTAVFQGNLADYVIEGRTVTTRAADLDGDGFISVTDLNDGPVVRPSILVDDVDKLKNIELLRFADQTIAIAGPDVIAPTNIKWNGTAPGSGLPGAGTIATLSTEDLNSTSFTYTLLSQSAGAGFAVNGAGSVTRSSVLPANTTYTLTVRSTDQTGAFVQETFTVRTGNGTLATPVNDTLNGNATDDVMYGLYGSDILNGLDGDDTLNGGEGNDRLVGGVGDDTMTGGAGDDAYVVDSAADVVNEASGAGVDTVEAALDFYVLGANIERLVTASGSIGNRNWTGNELNNWIQGSAGTDELNGLAGDDRLLGAAGDDTLTGDTGNDTLDGGADNDVMSGGTGNDWFNGGTGNDIMSGGAGDDIYVVDSLQDTVTEEAGEGSDTVQTDLAEYSLGGNVEKLMGVAGSTTNHIWSGNALDNWIRGENGNDTLNGLGGDDFLTGGGGSDIMRGGLGNDIYVVDSLQDTVTEELGEGSDTVQTVLGAYTLGENVEKLMGVAGSTINHSWTGNALDNWMRGENGNDTLNGLAGNDALVGGAGGDTINGGQGNDWLNGGIGNDTMNGGAGNDIYLVDSVQDTVTEQPGEGSDAVQAELADYTLGENVEKLMGVIGSTVNHSWTGNALDNWMRGENGNDTLNGLAGNDFLTGGAGNDTMSGGAGNDIYVVDSLQDTVTEALGEGSDTVQTDIGDYTLGENVEKLMGVAGGTINHNWTGNALDNWIRGANGTDTLNGLAGNDFLIGGIGNDIMTGGSGNDIYDVDSLQDTVTEALGGGNDAVQTDLGTYSLAENVESLMGLAGSTANHSWTGNALDNWMRGEGGSDTLNGLAGNDSLLGGASADTLNGGAGRDSLTGNAGNDIFKFSDVSDSGTTVATRDNILDFVIGQDKIDLSGIDAVTGGVDDNFSLIGGAAFTAAGQLRFFNSGGTTIVEGNVAGDLAADFQIALTGAHALQAAEFAA
ncbi:Ca2+-binding RTX toxin-like protein [Nitrosospira sp. Nsp2]|uniref:peroxidase family protein n=1 Tax=Nitrosospira sp. Nsp2 TaxID=136548 RepID=UPI000D30C703|nr:peroxidase family protein [Nitrosospira sp. Nsp2]PTR14803.1 Ca2+-binding RTX toxin-like protein [Nitrosospira sp. Nsp2]